MRIRDAQHEVHQLAREKGWHDDGQRNIGEQLALVHSEISEALEEIRAGRNPQLWLMSPTGKPEGFPIELADAVIRILDLCGSLDIDLEGAIREKHEYNKTRPHRHGGKKF